LVTGSAYGGMSPSRCFHQGEDDDQREALNGKHDPEAEAEVAWKDEIHAQNMAGTVMERLLTSSRTATLLISSVGAAAAACTQKGQRAGFVSGITLAWVACAMVGTFLALRARTSPSGLLTRLWVTVVLGTPLLFSIALLNFDAPDDERDLLTRRQNALPPQPLLWVCMFPSGVAHATMRLPTKKKVCVAALWMIELFCVTGGVSRIRFGFVPHFEELCIPFLVGFALCEVTMARFTNMLSEMLTSRLQPICSQIIALSSRLEGANRLIAELEAARRSALAAHARTAVPVVAELQTPFLSPPPIQCIREEACIWSSDAVKGELWTPHAVKGGLWPPHPAEAAAEGVRACYVPHREAI